MKGLWFVITAVALVFSVMADFLLPMGEGNREFWWSHFWGFFALFGFISCAAIVVVAKLMGHYWLQREEDYYD